MLNVLRKHFNRVESFQPDSCCKSSEFSIILPEAILCKMAETDFQIIWASVEYKKISIEINFLIKL
jgi:hypothetical protein